MAELPPGLTPEMMDNLAAFFTAQQTAAPPRPSGLLTPNQIRGVNPRYQYSFREYPKAITPPDIIVRDANHERTLRVQWGRPLPWDGPDGAPTIKQYYDGQEYPKRVTPPQIIVSSAEEEAAKIAAWRAEGKTVDDVTGRQYPMWRFHPEKQAMFVTTREQDEALGKGWFDTPVEAQNAAKSSVTDEAAERDDLLARATVVNLVVNDKWGMARLRREVEAAEAKKAA